MIYHKFERLRKSLSN